MTGWILCTSENAIAKAGLNANSDIVTSSPRLLQWSKDAEGMIESETRRKWVTDFSSLSDTIKDALSAGTSSYVAMQICSYDNTGYLPREADMVMNRNDEIWTRSIRVLKDFKSNTIKDV